MFLQFGDDLNQHLWGELKRSYFPASVSDLTDDLAAELRANPVGNPPQRSVKWQQINAYVIFWPCVYKVSHGTRHNEKKSVSLFIVHFVQYWVINQRMLVF